MAVDPHRQGAGIDWALLEFAESFARRHSRQEFRLYTNVAMIENITFYTSLGYRGVDRRIENDFQRVYFAKGVD